MVVWCWSIVRCDHSDNTHRPAPYVPRVGSVINSKSLASVREAPRSCVQRLVEMVTDGLTSTVGMWALHSRVELLNLNEGDFHRLLQIRSSFQTRTQRCVALVVQRYMERLVAARAVQAKLSFLYDYERQHCYLFGRLSRWPQPLKLV